jgi:hypothetical protein
LIKHFSIKEINYLDLNNQVLSTAYAPEGEFTGRRKNHSSSYFRHLDEPGTDSLGLLAADRAVWYHGTVLGSRWPFIPVYRRQHLFDFNDDVV